MPARWRERLSVFIITFLVLALVAGFFQWREGAYRSEFGGHPDEAAHYVTGLFVHDAGVAAKDYILGGCHGSPLKVGRSFVEDYYAHYPKIGLGVWPPLFYSVQSAWMALFGVSRESVLILMACLAGGCATVLFAALRAEFGAGLGFCGAVLWLSLPLVQQYAGMMMAEMLSALTMFAAVLCFGRYLDGRRPRDAVFFGLLASAAILTKGTGLALCLVPPLAILWTGRFSLLKERALWTAGGIVLVVAGPWTFATRKLGQGGWEEPHPSLHFTLHALPYYGWKLAVALGVLLIGLALIGVWDRLMREPGKRSGQWAGCLALIIGVVIFQSIAPAGREARHLIPALPAAVMFAIAGLAWIAKRVGAGAGTVRWRVAGAVALALLVFYGAPQLGHGACPAYGSIGDTLRVSPFRICPKDSVGFGPVAAALMKETVEGKPATFLVSSDATGEGMLIAEVAMHDLHRPGHRVRRASKELAASSWNGGGYKQKFESEEALLAYLTSGVVDFVVLDTAIPERNRRPHHEMLQRVIVAHPERFEPVAAPQPLIRGGEPMPGGVEAYRVKKG